MELAATRQAIFVLGMHRSGTSAFAGVLARLGVQMGRRLYGPQAGVNERGFWEHEDIVEAHDDLLRLAGSSWDDILVPQSETGTFRTPGPPGVAQVPAIAGAVAGAPLRRGPSRNAEGPPFPAELRRLERVVRRDFGRAALWGLKDPRACRLLPVWHRLSDHLGFAIRPVHVLRPPVEVAASLARRNGFSAEKSHLLWLGHVLEAERETRGQPRVFTLYDQLLEDPIATLERVEGTLGLRFPVAPAAALDSVQAFLSRDLRHHRAAGGSPEPGPARLAADVFEVLAAVARGEGGDPAPALDAVAARLAEYQQTAFAPVLLEHLRSVAAERGHYERLFLNAYTGWAWRLAWPLRALERRLRGY